MNGLLVFDVRGHNPQEAQESWGNLDPGKALGGLLEILPEIQRLMVIREGDSDQDIWGQYSGALVPEMVTIATPWEDLIPVLQERVQNQETVVYARADSPFVYPTLARNLWDRHHRYRADYTLAEGYPRGLAPEILRGAILPHLEKEKPVLEIYHPSAWFFDHLAPKINQFSVEALFAPLDLRTLRLDFRTNSALGRKICSSYAPARREMDPEAFLAHIQENQEALRSWPTYIRFQGHRNWLQEPSYLPLLKQLPQDSHELKSREFREWILDPLSELDQVMTFNPCYFSEPSLYGELLEVASLILARKGAKLVLETSGLGWSRKKLEDLAVLVKNQPDFLVWIVHLDALKPESYQKIRGEGWEEVQAFLDTVLELFPGRVYPQAVRIQDNEEELEAFYRHWREKAGRAIIDKYNWFSGRQPQERISDLSPLKREACWHIKREMIILAEGTVVRCPEDLLGEEPWGNLRESALLDLWEKGAALHRDHLKGHYPGLCGACDEYYTFHF